MIKTYIILREDLNMSSGKMTVQGGHAMDLVWSIVNEHPTDNVIDWAEKCHRRKIVLKIGTLEKLMKLGLYLQENNILFFDIFDNGLTEFAGKTLTGIVIPPYYEDEKLRALPKFRRLQLWS